MQKIKENLRLNLCLNTFQDQCYSVNEILMKENLFLRIYEKRKKLRYLILKPPTGENTVIRDLSSCVIEGYDGYEVVKIEQSDSTRKDFRLLDIVYEPVDDLNKIIECYFTEKIHIAYHLKYSREKK